MDLFRKRERPKNLLWNFLKKIFSHYSLTDSLLLLFLRKVQNTSSLIFIPSHILMHPELIPAFLTFSSLFSSLWTKLQSQPLRTDCYVLSLFSYCLEYSRIYISFPPLFLKHFIFQVLVIPHPPGLLLPTTCQQFIISCADSAMPGFQMLH